MSESANVRLVKEAYDAFKRGDIKALLTMSSKNVEWITPGPPDILPTAGNRHGRDEVAKFFATLADTEDVELFEPREFISQGEKVVALIGYRGRVKATKRTVECDLVHVFTIRDGKIERFQEFFDTAAAVDAMRPASSKATHTR